MHKTLTEGTRILPLLLIDQVKILMDMLWKNKNYRIRTEDSTQNY